jgi:hypothetical protein
MSIQKQLKTYQITTVITILLTLVGFSYNVWRLEKNEINTNIRTSSFELIKQLGELEEIIYYAHYDKNLDKGNPKKAWIKVIVITDLCLVASNMLEHKAKNLKAVWTKNWNVIHHDPKALKETLDAIEALRKKIQTVLHDLN